MVVKGLTPSEKQERLAVADMYMQNIIKKRSQFLAKARIVKIKSTQSYKYVDTARTTELSMSKIKKILFVLPAAIVYVVYAFFTVASSPLNPLLLHVFVFSIVTYLLLSERVSNKIILESKGVIINKAHYTWDNISTYYVLSYPVFRGECWSLFIFDKDGSPHEYSIDGLNHHLLNYTIAEYMNAYNGVSTTSLPS